MMLHWSRIQTAAVTFSSVRCSIAVRILFRRVSHYARNQQHGQRWAKVRALLLRVYERTDRTQSLIRVGSLPSTGPVRETVAYSGRHVLYVCGTMQRDRDGVRRVARIGPKWFGLPADGSSGAGTCGISIRRCK